MKKIVEKAHFETDTHFTCTQNIQCFPSKIKFRILLKSQTESANHATMR